jgi:hypothetical protein
MVTVVENGLRVKAKPKPSPWRFPAVTKGGKFGAISGA